MTTDGEDMEIYFNDELVAIDAKLNATTYVLEEEIKDIPKLFKLKVMNGEEIVEEKERAYVSAHYKTEEGWYLCFGEVNEKEYLINKQQAQIEYLVMMTDNNLGV